ncbi:MAG TPA: hypothetical protein VKT70_03635 [Stellaceae bacterium]|nr:hypothetical protein [Stellaceae bacterium]
MLVICDGMLRSGSTWSFMAAVALLKAQNQGEVRGFYSDDPADIFTALADPSAHTVIKSHLPAPAFYELCRAGAVKVIYTWRCPYAVVASAVRMFGLSQDEWREALRHALRLWAFHQATNSACIIPYPALTLAPGPSLCAIASTLEVGLESAIAGSVADAVSLEQAKKISDGVDDTRGVRRGAHVFDPQTLLHRHHISEELPPLDHTERAIIDTLLSEEGFGFLRE